MAVPTATATIITAMAFFWFMNERWRMVSSMLLFSPRPLRTLSERRRFGGHYPIFTDEKEDKSVHGPNELSR